MTTSHSALAADELPESETPRARTAASLGATPPLPPQTPPVGCLVHHRGVRRVCARAAGRGATGRAGGGDFPGAPPLANQGREGGAGVSTH